MSELWKPPRTDDSAGSTSRGMDRLELRATLADLARAAERETQPPGADPGPEAAGHEALAGLAAKTTQVADAPPAATDPSPATEIVPPARPLPTPAILSGGVPHPAGGASSPPAGAVLPDRPAAGPVLPGRPPVAGAGDPGHPMADTARPTADTAHPTADTAHPTADTARPTADTARPTADTARPVADKPAPLSPRARMGGGGPGSVPVPGSTPSAGWQGSPGGLPRPASTPMPGAVRLPGQKPTAAVPAALDQPTIAMRRRPVASGPASVSAAPPDPSAEAAPANGPAPRPVINVTAWAPSDDDILPGRQMRRRRSWRRAR